MIPSPESHVKVQAVARCVGLALIAPTGQTQVQIRKGVCKEVDHHAQHLLFRIPRRGHHRSRRRPREGMRMNVLGWIFIAVIALLIFGVLSISIR